MEPKIQERNFLGARDKNSNRLFAYDIVKIVSLPDFLYNDNDFANGMFFYRKLIGCLGLIRYQDMYNLPNVLWYGENETVLLDAVYESIDGISKFDLAMPCDCIEKIPFNPEYYSLFIPFTDVIKPSEDDENAHFSYRTLKALINEI